MIQFVSRPPLGAIVDKEVDIRNIPRFVQVSDGELVYQLSILVEYDLEEGQMPPEIVSRGTRWFSEHKPETSVVSGFAKSGVVVPFQNSKDHWEGASSSMCKGEDHLCMDGDAPPQNHIVRSEEGYDGNNRNHIIKG